MKWRSLLIVFCILMALRTPGFTQVTYGPLTFSTDISGPAIWMDGSIKTVAAGGIFFINVNVTYDRGPNDSMRQTWSSPFTFTQTGLASLTWTDYNTWPDPAFYNNTIWDAFKTLYVESWGDGLPDLFAIEGIANAGGLPGGTTSIMHARAIATLVDPMVTGTICIEQGHPIDPLYDWLFDDPIPNLTKTCFPVKKVPCRGCLPPAFTNCPTQLATHHGAPLSYDFEASDVYGDPIIYSIISGPGTIDTSTGVWTWVPPCDSVGKNISLVVCARTSTASCPTGRECTVNLVVQNTPPVIGGDCGNSFVRCDGPMYNHFSATDANIGDTRTWSVMVYPSPMGVYGISPDGELMFDPDIPYDIGVFNFTIRVTDCAGDYDECDATYYIVSGAQFPGDANNSYTYNALDITYLINFLYKSGPPPIPDPACSGDANCSCTTSILDITHLINYLYKHGEMPCTCGGWVIHCQHEGSGESPR